MKKVPKVWGKELWIVNNESYCGKILCVAEGAQSSFHTHLRKKETFLCLAGMVLLDVEDKTYVFTPASDPITIEPGQYHSFWGRTDSVILEISTHHDDEDVIRLTESQRGNEQSVHYR